MREDERPPPPLELAGGARARGLSLAQREQVLQLGSGSPAAELLTRLLGGRGYCRELARDLLAGAKGVAGESWRTRCLCALMLEHVALRLPAEVGEQHLHLFDGLGLLAADGCRLREAVLREGFSATDPESFAPQFAERLSRNEAIHGWLEASPDSVSALRRFLSLAHEECRLLLARYLFSPQEVVERFLQQVRSSEAAVSPFLIKNGRCVAEAETAIRRLPEFEAEIVRRVLERQQIFWVAERPNRRINSLVEYPLHTVALVLKPPGSWIEIQFKRAGRPRPCPLGVTWHTERGGTAPYQHQLDGGGYGKSLEWESSASATASVLFRRVHGAEARVSRPVSVQTVCMLPTPEGPVDVLNYFTHPGAFGPDYPAMRSALRGCVDQYRKNHGWKPPFPEGDARLTSDFLVATKPAQGILVGSSSFRVDKLAYYLSPRGAYYFFEEGLGSQVSGSEQRCFADALLAEILPGYRPPRTRPESYGEYVEDAFALGENRRRADRAYLGLLAQAGRYWGTLLAAGASSRGESFVGRNVGLRSVWEDGKWQTVLIFMDNDQLHFYGPSQRRFRPLDSVASMVLDEEYLVETCAGATDTKSLLDLLDAAYHVDAGVREEGRKVFREQLAAAYRETRRKQVTGELGRFSTRILVRGLADWDESVRRFLEARQAGDTDGWESGLRAWLAGRKYGKGLIGEYLTAMRKYSKLLEKYTFLYMADGDRGAGG